MPSRGFGKDRQYTLHHTLPVFIPFAGSDKPIPIAFMKTFLLIFAALAMPVLALAADLLLSDGRSFKDATIMSQTPRTVTVKHANGLSSVAKELLPPDLKALYPVDETAAREAERHAVSARETTRELEKAEAERVARLRAERVESVAANTANAERDAAREEAKYAAVEREAAECAKHYFQYEYNPGNNSATPVDCSVTLSEVRPVEGWSGRWFVRGRRLLTYFQRQGRTFTSQTRDFEATYYKDGRKANFEVTLR